MSKAERIEKRLQAEWHNNLCGCATGPDACVYDMTAPDTFTVEAVLAAAIEVAAYCCKRGCEADAQFEIWNASPGAHPYDDYTHACDHHVGELLRSVNGSEWSVTPVGGERHD